MKTISFGLHKISAGFILLTVWRDFCLQDLRFSWQWRYKLRSSEWRQKEKGPLKCWYPIATLHGVTTQKTLTCTNVYTTYRWQRFCC